jgi:hypothetical protein
MPPARDVFVSANAVIMATFSEEDGWWLKKAAGAVPVAVSAVVTFPDFAELDNVAAMSLRQRYIELEGAAASAGDLVSFLQDGVRSTWRLTGDPEPDDQGLNRRFVAEPFERAVAYRADGSPMLAWNGAAFVAVNS